MCQNQDVIFLCLFREYDFLEAGFLLEYVLKNVKVC